MHVSTRRLLGAVLVPVGLVPVAAVGQQDAPAQPQLDKTIVRTDRVFPKRVLVVRSTFQPWSQPSPSQVHRIIDVEAARASISASGLRSRVGCESTFNWAATNGQYVGILQFAPSTFARGWSSVSSRRVRYVLRRERAKRVRLIDYYSDGSLRGRWGWKRRQKVVHVYSGLLPRHPPVMHAWAQIRIGAEAIAGRSAVSSSEWACAA